MLTPTRFLWSGWMRALGGVILAISGWTFSINVVANLPLVLSDSCGSAAARVASVFVAFVTVPFIFLGGSLAFYPFSKKKVWRCTICDFILGPP